MALSHLPHELLVQIADQLWLPDIYNLAISSKRLFNVCSKSLARQVKFQREYRCVNLEVIRSKYGDMYKFFASISRNEGFHYVREVHITLYLDDDRFGNDPEHSHLPRVQDFDVSLLIDLEARLEALGVPFEDIAPTWGRTAGMPLIPLLLKKASKGLEEAVFAAMLPLYTNLTRVCFPDRIPPYLGFYLWADLDTFFEVLAKTKPQPYLNKLDTFIWDPTPESDLDSVQPFLALPSMRRMRFRNCQECEDPHLMSPLRMWALTKPKSGVEDIELVDVAMGKARVQRVASGIAGPCNIRLTGRQDRRPEADRSWNTCVIPFAGAGPDDLIFRYESGR